MIPYIYIPTIQMGPITLQVWGAFVSLGILVSIVIAHRLLKDQKSKDYLLSLSFWIILGSMLGARFAFALAYQPKIFIDDPWEFFRIWHGGLSSFGGFIGGTIAAILYLRKKNLEFASYAYAIIQSIPLGWAIGRIGCFLIHDHPGTLTHSIIGVKYPDGARYDLGLVEILNALGMGAIMLWVKKFGAKDSTVSAAGLVWYGVVRFFTDFLRARDLPGSDARYLGLTPAQYGSILICLSAIFILSRSSRARA